MLRRLLDEILISRPCITSKIYHFLSIFICQTSSKLRIMKLAVGLDLHMLHFCLLLRNNSLGFVRKPLFVHVKNHIFCWDTNENLESPNRSVVLVTLSEYFTSTHNACKHLSSWSDYISIVVVQSLY